jgi:tRNA threonylcarbamoyladenosine biosynthesis protein TsaB
LKILAIETTGKYGSASLIDDTGRVYSASSHTEMDHLRGIISLVDEALNAAGTAKAELTHIAASVGPGSFTGIRIGVTTVRTMSQMLGIPCIGVSSLEALSRRIDPEAYRQAGHGEIRIVPVINARRHQTYAGAWDGSGRAILEERQYMIEELLGILMGEENTAPEKQDNREFFTVFTGDGIDAYSEIIETTMPAGSFVFAPEEIRYQHSETVADIALEMASAGKTKGYDELMPEYMRLAEAEQRLKAGTLSDRIRKPVL